MFQLCLCRNGVWRLLLNLLADARVFVRMLVHRAKHTPTSGLMGELQAETSRLNSKTIQQVICL